MSGPHAEGVVKFEVEHRVARLDERTYGETAALLAAWREVLARLTLIGQDPRRYEGAAYGNVSARLGPFGDVARGRRRFLVTATQTGGKRALTLDDFCVVERYDLAHNRVVSIGAQPPSSESMTHGALYDVAPAVRVVLHGHAPELWRHARALGLPITDAAVPYGTPAMAHEVQRLWRESTAASMGIVAMGGHEDGIIAFANSAADAGETLVRHLARALALSGR
jgi:L-ribulose-5-phosphate 4-epimerase